MRKRNPRRRRDGTPVEGGTEAVEGSDSVVLCGGFVIERLAVVYLEVDDDMFVDACVTKVKPSQAADVIEDVVETTELEGA